MRDKPDTMKMITFQRWWILSPVVTVITIILWLCLLPSPRAPPAHVPPIPSHSNSRLLPFKYWQHRSLYPELYNDLSCTRFPSISEVRYAANTWQLLQLENGSVYLYGAYWDDRREEPVVRVLLYSDVLPLPKLYCQLWYPGDNEPQVELAEVLYGWEPTWGGPTIGVNEPYILSCMARRHAPERNQAPAAVTVVTAPCDVATNALNVQGAPNEIKDKHKSSTHNVSIAVCVKWLHFRRDVSNRIIEWLQILKHFGAEKAFLYTVRLHPKTKRAIQHYEKSGFAVVTEISHPPQVSGVHFSRWETEFHDYRRELLPLNDCLYRNLGRYDWLAVIDLDELIVPERDGTWLKLINREISSSPEVPLDSLTFRNYYVLDGAQKDLLAPPHARLLAHTWRARVPSAEGNYVKSFFNTSSVTAMHNHSPLRCHESCNSRTVNVTDARLMHFRERCEDNRQTCAELTDVVRDDVMAKWRKQVLEEIEEVVKEIKENV